MCLRISWFLFWFFNRFVNSRISPSTPISTFSCYSYPVRQVCYQLTNWVRVQAFKCADKNTEVEPKQILSSNIKSRKHFWSFYFPFCKHLYFFVIKIFKWKCLEIWEKYFNKKMIQWDVNATYEKSLKKRYKSIYLFLISFTKKDCLSWKGIITSYNFNENNRCEFI